MRRPEEGPRSILGLFFRNTNQERFAKWQPVVVERPSHRAAIHKMPIAMILRAEAHGA
jgi:hypothetical protein